jgi:ribonuclease HI
MSSTHPTTQELHERAMSHHEGRLLQPLRARHKAATDIYCDGGCINSSGSFIGGMWAFLVTIGPTVVSRQRCVVLSASAPMPKETVENLTVVRWPVHKVTNNQMELAAAAFALRVMPDTWSGRLNSDSQITLGRVTQGWRRDGVPPWLSAMLDRQLARLGTLTPRLLAGHPTREELLCGFKTKYKVTINAATNTRTVRQTGQYPVSIHNVECDRLCNEAERLYRESLEQFGADDGESYPSECIWVPESSTDRPQSGQLALSVV